MDNQSSESKIDRLRKQLDSQNQPDATYPEDHLPQVGRDVRRRWQHDDHEPSQEPPKQKKGSFINKLLIFSSIFFVLAFAIAVFSIGFGESDVSPDKVDITVTGPEAISAGEATSFDISISNNNSVFLRDVALIIAYPDGSREPGNTGQELSRTRQSIGTIAPEETVNETIQASLFGGEGDSRSISIQLEYQIEGSNAIFTVTDEHAVEISDSPVVLNIDTQSQATPGEPVTLSITVGSNSSELLDNVLLVADYPFGFTVNSVEPETAYRQNVWRLGDMSSDAERDITITGTFTDNNRADNKQVFRFDAGIAQTNDATEIGTLFASQNTEIILEEPFIELDLDISTQSLQGNRLSVSGEAQWRSNLDTVIRGGQITASLSGAGIDPETVESDEGIYRGGDQIIEWSSRTNDELTNIAPGDSGEFNFSFETTAPELLAQNVKNPMVDISLNMRAQAPDSSTLPNPVTASLGRQFKLPTVISLAADTLYEDGPITNTGPVPPEVDEATTYTLHLSVANTTNQITNTRLHAALPAYVELSSNPSGLSYNSISGRMTWDIGTVAAGAGYTAAPKEIFIPVTVMPAASHVNRTLPLLEDISITGDDAFRGESIQIRDISPPTTELDDLRAGDDTGRVQR